VHPATTATQLHLSFRGGRKPNPEPVNADIDIFGSTASKLFC
jgi:hypothetical protein